MITILQPADARLPMRLELSSPDNGDAYPVSLRFVCEACQRVVIEHTYDARVEAWTPEQQEDVLLRDARQSGRLAAAHRCERIEAGPVPQGDAR